MLLVKRWHVIHYMLPAQSPQEVDFVDFVQGFKVLFACFIKISETQLC